MQLGYHSSGLQNHRLAEALHLLAERGFQVVALTPDVMHLDPYRASRREVEEAAQLLDRLGLRVVVETGARYLLDARHKHEPTLMTRDPEGRRLRLDFYRRCAALGRDLGARVVSFWSGIDREPGPDSADRLVAGIAEACAVIRAEGMEPSLEPEPGMAVETTADYRRVRSALGDGAPALTLDVGHLYAVWEGDPAAVAGGCAPFLAQVHLEDMRKGVHEHLEPGAGDVDFEAVLTELQQGGYDGPACFELSRSSHRGPEGLAACHAVFERWRRGLRR